jgi:hypothetical protein
MWIAHPGQKDHADKVPGSGEIHDGQASAQVDIFFIYPTLYSGRRYADHPYFADVYDPKLNEVIAESTIQYQASVFNGSARVYAPLYRQGHISIFKKDSVTREKVLRKAYQDVRTAFLYYLEHWNEGRPVLIASHSQGSYHAARLLKEFFEGKPLMDQLVAAYIIGFPFPVNHFSQIPVCESPDQTGCWLSWCTFKDGYYPRRKRELYLNGLSVNPLSWRKDTVYVAHEANIGGVLRNFEKIYPGLTDARVHKGLLWIHKPRFFGNFLLFMRNYHIADYNLFYMNIRENVALRVETFLDSNPQTE